MGEGLKSASVSIIAGTVPGPPSSLLKVSADTTQITFSWSAPSDNGGTPLVDYQIYWDNGINSGQHLLKNSTGIVT